MHLQGDKSPTTSWFFLISDNVYLINQLSQCNKADIAKRSPPYNLNYRCSDKLKAQTSEVWAFNLSEIL
ncbi:hypothetical protein THIOM_005328 [Candidatus Thiomargarita nelsonii]|uniref:Uncharacterized protein n=1 Tax=Candidatus Thiomargarita nelsonii TaxID=1003181 RepID=A0A176RTJ9_9GAMM|nr:hypothetical protein THIOM_005328 [Candidatus Thiomargarita nelsonii]